MTRGAAGQGQGQGQGVGRAPSGDAVVAGDAGAATVSASVLAPVLALVLASVLALLALAGCVEVRQREAPSGEPSCLADAECPAEAAVCDLATSRCVQCLPERAEACAGTSPVCGEALACRGCSAHSECASSLCLPDGSCAAEADIAYAEARATGMTCSKAAPCALISQAVARGKPYVKASGEFVESNGLTLGNQAVKIFGASGASLRSGRDAFVVRVIGNPGVELHGLAISGGKESGIDLNGTLAVIGCLIDGNSGVGISAPGGVLRVERSILSNNTLGGISASNGTKLTLLHNVIVQNGRAAAGVVSVGGVMISSSATGGRLEWNTIAFNQSSGQSRGGATCSRQTIESIGNVLFHNSELNNGSLVTSLATQAAADGCITARDKVVATDASNLGFTSVTAPLDFHLLPSSPLIDAAGGNCDGLDLDGQPRPQGGACDYGADEADR